MAPSTSLWGIANVRARLVSTLDACATATGSLCCLKRVLSWAVVTGLLRDPFVSGRAVAAATAHSDLNLAHLAFYAASPRPSAFAFTALIRAHSAGPDPTLSLRLFVLMLRSGFYLDHFALPFALRASARSCPSSAGAQSLHAVALCRGLLNDAHVATSLLHAYASFGLLDAALRVFNKMLHKTTVTYNCIISSCVRTCCEDKGFSLFAEMLSSGTIPNTDTFVGALSCCASFDSLAYGRSVHALATRRLCYPTIELSTNLLHMYVKCGRLEAGRKVFDKMQMRDVSLWTAMIGGLAMHGHGKEAIELFERMVMEGVAPDSMVYTNVLSACCHSGLVEKGMELFHGMKKLHGVEPRMEHYGVMVDLLGRGGRLEEAVQVIKSMPFKPNQVIWGSLLNACMIKGEIGLQKRFEWHLLRLGFGGEEEEVGFSVGVSNVYARTGRWDEVERVRDKMVERGVKKVEGFSLVEVNGMLHKFLVGDTKCPLADELYQVLQAIERQMLMI